MKKLLQKLEPCGVQYVIDVAVMVLGTLVLIAFLWGLLVLAGNL